MSKDYYKILGVEKNATKDEIKKAFRKQAHKYHPDKQGGNEQKFKELNEAYQVLSNEQKRSQYDQFGSTFDQAGGGGGYAGGMNWQDFAQGFGGAQGAHFDMGDLGDIFSEMFGGGGRSRRQKPSYKGADIEAAINLDFEEAVFGVEKEVEIKKISKCNTCDGQGSAPGTSMDECSKCNGTGTIRVAQNVLFGQIQTQRSCPDCQGRGKTPKQRCSDCLGEGVKSGTEKIKIKIPEGISNGEVIRLTGKGNAGRYGSIAGDLYLHIRVNGHKNFKREGDDIHSKQNIKIWQASLGDKVKINTLDGEITLKIPEGTQSGTIFRLKSHGVPHLNKRGRGDHYVEIIVDIPEKLTKDQRNIIKKLKDENI